MRMFVEGLAGCVDWGLASIKPDTSANLPWSLSVAWWSLLLVDVGCWVLLA